jgi:hypothetical protein
MLMDGDRGEQKELVHLFLDQGQQLVPVPAQAQAPAALAKHNWRV